MDAISHVQENQVERKAPVKYVVSALLVFLVAVALVLLFSWTSARVTAVSQAKAIAAIESKYGIIITRVTPSFGGGVIDLRYKVLDAEKSSEYMHDPETMPVLLVEGRGVRIPPSERVHDNMTHLAGVGYYILYSNPNGVVHSGSKITIEFGDIQLKHVIVE